MLDVTTTVRMANLDEDEMLIRAMEESLRHYQEVELPIRQLQDDNIIPQSSPVKTSSSTAPVPTLPPVPKQPNPGPSSAPKSAEEKNTWSIFKPQDRKQPVAFTTKISTSSSTAPKPGTSKTSWSNDPQPGTSRSTLPGTAKLWQDIGSKASTSRDSDPQPPEDSEPLQMYSTEKTLTEKGFCRFTGKHWVYPTNYPERKYQVDMVQTALFHNTLVCLPTGLGKTFIAAVVMFNYYRWFPKGKIIFMAPTKPLVAQQVKACYEITGIPKNDTEEMTGMTNVERRTSAWKQKRVFFATPQVVANDLVAQICPADNVICLVVDEAHRAQGNYAYCQVINTLRAYTSEFRVLALSATPGSDMNAVKQVLQNLMISKLKIATEESPDVAQYTHHREIETITVKPTTELSDARNSFLKLMDKYWEPLVKNNIVSGFNTSNMTQFQVKTHMDKMLKSPPNWLNPSEVSRLQGYCLICISLCHAQELLQNYGFRSFLSYIQGVLKDSKSNKFVSGYLSKDEDLLNLIDFINDRLGTGPKKNGEKSSSSKIIYGHPKLQKLQEIVVNHFLEYEDNNEVTRAIIFCQYRDSVEEIKNILQVLEPIVKPMSFIGQAKSKGQGGLTQKQQLQVMRDFRSGDYNTLISTCVGEEGLDIGEVDLIVCVDASKSPIRLVQRMGRTGRKRSGRIVMILSEGKEYKKYIDSQKTHGRISKGILNNSNKLSPILNQMPSPRLIPPDVKPVIRRSVLAIPKDMKDQDIRKMATRKSANVVVASSFPTVEELAKWDGEVPSFDHLELKSKILSFISYGKVKSMLDGEVQEDLEEEEAQNGGFQLNHWLEWQRNLQGPNDAYHSSDSRILVEVLQLGDRMNLNNPTLLTQTADLVSEVDHDALWNNRKNKGKGRGKKSKTCKDTPPAGPKRGGIEWCLQQQSTKPKRPDTGFDYIEPGDDFDVFLVPKVPELKITNTPELPDNIQKTLEQLTLLGNRKEIKPSNPFHRVFTSLSVFVDAVIKTPKPPDLSMSPPSVSDLDDIFNELNLNCRPASPNFDLQESPPRSQEILFDLENLVPSQKSPILGKRKLPRSQQESMSVNLESDGASKIARPELTECSTGTKKIEPIASTSTSNASSSHKAQISPQIRSTMTSKNSTEPVAQRNNKLSEINRPITKIVSEPIASTSHNMDLSQGMEDFLMNFDLGFDDEDVKKIGESVKIVSPEIEAKHDVKVEDIRHRKEDKLRTEAKQNDTVVKSSAQLRTQAKQDNPSVKSSPQLKTQVQQDNSSVKSSPNIQVKPAVTCQVDFNILDEDDDLFADMDVSTWMGEFEKNITQKTETTSIKPLKTETKFTPKTPQIILETPSTVSTPRSSSPLLFSDDLNESPQSNKTAIQKTTPIFNKNIIPASTSSNESSLTSPVISKIQTKNKKIETSPLLFTESSGDNAKVGKDIQEDSTILDFSPLDDSVFASPKPSIKESTKDSKLKKVIPIDDEIKPLKINKLSITNKHTTKTKTDIVETQVKSPLLRQLREEHNTTSTSEDDSVVYRRKNVNEKPRGNKALIMSSDEDKTLGTQEEDKTLGTQDEPICISSDSDSEEIIAKPAPNKKKNVSNERKNETFSSDDDFTQARKLQNKKRKSKDKHDENTKKKLKKNRHARDFLDVEAEVSGEVDSEEEDIESSQMDRYDESFINNYTQADPSIDMRAQYLRSVKSPILQGKYKIPNLQNKKVYKSPGENLEEDSSYMNDSFCVESGGSGHDSGHSSEEEIDELEAKLEAKRQKKKKRPRHDISSPESAVKQKVKKLKRIIAVSSSDDESPGKNTTIKNAPSLETSMPLATSTPHVVKGFEGDYLDDDDDLEAIMAQISATQEAEFLKQSNKESKQIKKSSSRSLFSDCQETEKLEIKANSVQILNEVTPQNKPLSSIQSGRFDSEPGPSWKNAPTKSQDRQAMLNTTANDSRKTNLESMSTLPSNRKETLPQIKIPSAAGSKLSISKSRPTLSDPTLAGTSSARTAVVCPLNNSNSQSSRVPTTTTNAIPTSSTNQRQAIGSSSAPVIISSTRQVTSAPTLINLLQVTHKVNVLFKTLPAGVDFVISQRLAVGREQISNVTSCSAQSDLAIVMRSLRQNFRFIVLVLENGSSRPVPEPRTSWEQQRHILPGTKQLRMALCHLQRLNVKVVFTKDQAETAGILHNLAVKENQFKFGIIHDCKKACDPVFDARLRFFTTLPGVNIALALKLAHQFPVINAFINRCTSVGDIEKLLSINKRHATSIFQIISQSLQ